MPETEIDRLRQLGAEAKSQAAFRTLTEAMPNHVWTSSPDGRLHWFNDRTYEYSGATLGELNGRGWTSLVHPSDLPATLNRWQAAVSTGEVYETEFRLRRADGVYRWHIARAVPIRGEGGEITRWIGTNTDIEAQKSAAQALARLNRTLEQQAAAQMADRNRLWQLSSDILLVAGFDGVITAVNPAATAVLGWTERELIGRKLLDLIHRDDRARTEEGIKNLSCGAALRRFDARSRHKDGGLRWISWKAVPGDGFIHAVGRDFTAEKEKTEVLEGWDARIRCVFESSYQYQGLMTPDGILIDANPTSLAGIRARLEDVVGLPFWDTPWFTATPGLPEQVRAAITQVAAGQIARQEIVVNLPTGRRAFDFSMRPVFNAEGKVVAIVPEAIELTERRAAEEQLRQAHKMEAVGQLTGGIAHDFNNLLSGITGALDLIRRRISAGRTDEIERFMDAAYASVQRGAALTHRLLAFARRQSLDIKPHDVNLLVAGLEDLLRRTIGDDIAFETVLKPNLWPAMTDANQLENALLNLAINARDAMPEGGRLTIETANTRLEESGERLTDRVDPGDYVRVAVTDTGHGMPADVIAKAFDPFFTTKPVGQGTGLGLSMIYGFVKQSGGHVRIDSEVARGTTVTIYLRRAQPIEEHDRVAPEAAALRGRGETVLVVEDDVTARFLVTEMLRELGYRYVEAPDADTALLLLQADQTIDLLVTDVGLPHMNGRQLAEVARQHRPNLKVLYITSYAAAAASRGDFLRPGMEMITKPFALDALGAKLRELIEGRGPPAKT